MSKARCTWVMVADAAQARFFVSEGGQLRLNDEASLDDPTAHVRSHDLVSDRPGRTMESVGGAHHAEEPRVDPHRAAKAAFAKRVADFVEKSAIADKFDDLVMVAPPQMLGDLRNALGRHAAARLVGTAPKDLTKIPAAELKAHLQPLLTAGARHGVSGRST
jgi:protein required for attachment to host cells